MRNGLMVLDVHGALTKIRFEQLEATAQSGQAPAAQGLLFSLPVDLPPRLLQLCDPNKNFGNLWGGAFSCT